MSLDTDPSLDALGEAACARASQLIVTAQTLRTTRERADRRRFARLLRDHEAIDVTMALTDDVMRTGALDTLRRAARRASVRGFGPINALGLRLLARCSRVAPSLALRAVHSRVRSLSRELILDATPAKLQRHLLLRKRQGVQLNVNVLGEAVLGQREADERLARVLEMTRRDDVTYVSVKISSIVSQLTTIDHAGSSERVAAQLRILYRVAMAEGVFVNLDMEEFRDLRLTMDAFCAVLDEPEFATLTAGIVLQAYLPESHDALETLITWSRSRYARGAGQIKIRLVKGANLAMEAVEAELHGWTSAPYASKESVDASYTRLIDLALRAEHAHCLRVGVASHNLFDVAWAIEVATSRGVLAQLDIEMLEGMANGEALALAATGRHVLLYAPVTRRDDFASAVAYLVRRLDENTSPENYLRAAFYVASEPGVYDEQRRRFLDSLSARHHVVTSSRRHQATSPSNDHFRNAADGDPTDVTYAEAVHHALAAVRTVAMRDIPLVIDGVDIKSDDYEEGRDPSDGGTVWYRYAVASIEQIDNALASARAAAPRWAGVAHDERRAILLRAADVMASERASTIAVMARDAGKIVTEADPEVSEGIDFARYYASQTSDLADSSALGVVVVVPPWNFPYAIPSGGVCAALAAGNAVVLKPAPEAVATAYELVGQLWAGGVPRDVLQFVPTRDDDTGRHLVTHDDVDAVILTGSFDTARLFTSWKPEINLLAETSGKNAILVSASADIDLAVRDIVQSAFGHAGQKCSAASLAIVVQSTYDNPAFTRQLRDAVESLRVGPGYDPSTTVGPIIRPAEPTLARALNSLDPGESWLVEPHALDDAQLLWRPGVKLGVAPGSWSHQNEWFGPVLALMRAPDFATALAWQNDVDFGLTAGLDSLDEAECQHWIDHVEAGNVYLNRGVTGAVVSRQPFGGWKRSSVGPTAKAGGPHYVECLRHWPALCDVEAARGDLESWGRDVASLTSDAAALRGEANVRRFRLPLAPIIVRVDDFLDASHVAVVRDVVEAWGVEVSISARAPIEGLAGVQCESVDELVARASEMAKVRWLSCESAPVVALLKRGVSVDRRPLAQNASVEGPRWLLEQSVAMTRHRYGNVNAGPRPNCRGLGDA